MTQVKNAILSNQTIVITRYGRRFMIASVAFMAISSPAFASEAGMTQWPLGVQTAAPAILPPPGKTELYGYSLVYSAPKYNDKNQNPAIPGFHVDVEAQGLRTVHTWNYDKNGITLSMRPPIGRQ